MFFGAGQIAEALERGREKRQATRLENARLYNEFVRLNPGATTQERLDYANNLIKTTGAGNAGLPTKAQMERNYNKYKEEEARKAAARAQAAEQRRLAAIRQSYQDAATISKVLAPQFGTEGFSDLVKKNAESLNIPSEMFTMIEENAGKEAYNDWAKNNQVLIQTYMNDPTKAGYEALTTAPGADLFGDRLKSSYEQAYINAETEKVKALNNTLTQKAQSVDPEQWDIEKENILRGIPDSVKNQLDMKPYDDEVQRRRDVKAQREAQVAGGEFQKYILQNKATITQADADNFKAQLIAAAKSRGVTLADEAFEEGNTRLKEQLDLNAAQRSRVINETIGSANDLAAKLALGEATEAQVIAELESGLSTKFGEDYTLSQSDRTRFDNLVTQTKDRLASEAKAAVDAQVVGADVRSAAAGRATTDEIVRQIEAKLTASMNVGDVKFTQEQTKDLQDRIDSLREQIIGDIKNLADAYDDDPEQLTRAAAQTREQFVEQFVTNIRVQNNINTDDENYAELEDIASKAYDSVYAQIRKDINVKEEQSATKAFSDITGSLIVNNDAADDIVEVIEQSLTTSGYLGAGGDDAEFDPKVVKSDLAQAVNVQIADFTGRFDIALTPELTRAIMNELPNQLKTDAGASMYTVGGGLPPEAVDRAISAVIEDHYKLLGPTNNADIQLEAMNLTLQEVGAESLASMTPEQQAMYEATYRSNLKKAATSKYDVIAESKIEDFAPTAEVNELVTNTVSDLSAVESLDRQLDLIQPEPERIMNIDAIGSYMVDVAQAERNARDVADKINNEIVRLTNLARNPVYNTDNVTSVKIENEVAKLQERRSEVVSYLKHINKVKNRADQIGELAKAKIAEMERLAIERKQQQKQDGLVGGSSSRTRLTPDERSNIGLEPEAESSGGLYDLLNRTFNFNLDTPRPSIVDRNRR